MSFPRLSVRFLIAVGLVSCVSLSLFALQLFKSVKLRMNLHSLRLSELLEYEHVSLTDDRILPTPDFVERSGISSK